MRPRPFAFLCSLAFVLEAYWILGAYPSRAQVTPAPASPTAASISRTPTIDQSLELNTVAAPRISPDGRRILYEQSRTNWESNAFETDLWIADLDTGTAHRLTLAQKSSSSAAWSPDGRSIAFLSDRVAPLRGSPADKKQIYVMPADGGEAQQLTISETGIKAFAWTPDSRRIAFTAESAETKEIKDRKESFGEYHVAHADYTMIHLWLIDLPQSDSSGRIPPAPEPRILTPGDAFTVEDFSVSPDGARIAFSAQRDPDLISGFSSDIYTVTLADLSVKKIVDTPGPDSNPQWSPDSTRIAYETSAGARYFYYENHRIAIVAAGGGAPRVLTSSFDEDPDLIRWSPAGIYFGARQKTNAWLYLLNPETSTSSRVELPGIEDASQFSFSTDYRNVAFREAAANHYAEIYTSSLPASNISRPTRAGEQLSAFDTARRELIRWKSADGTTIEGILYKPSTFSPAKRYPLLVAIHGGPTGIDIPAINPDRYYPIERFLSKGALVLRPNYRGSAGYGEKFRTLNVRNLGVGDYADADCYARRFERARLQPRRIPFCAVCNT